MSWMRYPGRLAHLTTDGSATPAMGRAVGVSGPVRVGSTWRTRCGRYLTLRFDDRPWQASWVDPIELRDEEPRGWCLRCAYWAALDALILPGRSFEGFTARVQTGHYELVDCSVAA